jgi:hypothetical protein
MTPNLCARYIYGKIMGAPLDLYSLLQFKDAMFDVHIN